MKKNYLNWMTIVVVAILSVGFVSCSKDDDDDYSSSTELVNKLQGTWEFTKGVENIMGMTITLDRSSLSQMKAQMEQALGEQIYIWDETLIFSGSKVNGIEYRLNGKNIILDGLDETDGIVSVKSITSSTLVLYEEVNMEGNVWTAEMEYRKK